MGTLSAEQAKKAAELGFDPSDFEGVSQESIDKSFPATRAAPVSRPQQVEPTAPIEPVAPPDVSLYAESPATPEPIVKPPAPPQIGFPTGAYTPPAAAKGAPSYPFQREDVDTSRYGKAQTGLLPLAAEYINARSRGTEDQIDPEKEKVARKKAEVILGQRFTPGGQKGSLTAPFAVTPTADPSLLEVLSPQRLATPEETQYAKDLEYDSSMAAVTQLDAEYKRAIDKAAAEGNTSRERELKQKLETLDTAGVTSNPDFILRKSQLKDYNLKVRASADPGKIPPFQANFEDASVYEQGKAAVTQVVGDVATSLFLQEQPGEGIVETPLGYVGRLLGAPVSGMVGVVEGAVTSKDADTAAKERIREGLSVLGAGLSIADAAIEYSGLPKDDDAAKAARYLGGGAGLIVDFLLPVFPGINAASAGLKATRTSMAAEKALGKTSTVSAATLAGLKRSGAEVLKATAPFVTAVPSVSASAASAVGKGLEAVSSPTSVSGASRRTSAAGSALQSGAAKVKAALIAPEFADDIVSSAITRFGKDKQNQRIMSQLIEMEDALDFAKIRKAPDPDVELATQLEAIYNASPGTWGSGTFDAWASATSKVADPLDQATWRDLRGDLPSSIRRASISDALNPTQKAGIARGSALTSDDMTKALLDLALRKNLDLEPIVRVRSGNIPATVSGLTADKLLEIIVKGTEKAPLQNNPAILEHLLYGIGNQKLTSHLLSSPRLANLLPNYARITRSSLLPADQATSAIREFSERLGSIRDRVAEAIRRGDDVAELTPDEVQSLIDLTAPTSLRYLPQNMQDKLLSYVDGIITEGDVKVISIGGKDRVIPRISAQKAQGKIPGPSPIFIDVKRYNALAEAAMDAIASKKSGYKTIFEVDKELTSIDPVKKGSGITKETYLSKVLTPRQIAGGDFESMLKGATSVGDSKAGSSILSQEFSSEIANRWGSIPEDFKSKYRQARAQGLSAPDAWSKVMVDNYILESKEIIRDLELTASNLAGSGDPKTVAYYLSKIDDIEAANYGQMFDDYIAMMYGGYESMAEAISTTGRTSFLDGRLIDTSEMRQITFIMGQHPFIKEARDAFVLAARNGKSSDALLNLRNAHATIQGRGILQFLGDVDELETAYNAAKLVDTNGILVGTYLGSQFKKGKPGNRSIIDLWDYAKEAAPMFLVDDHLKLLGSQYLTRRQSGIVADMYQDYSKTMPDLFPSIEGINKNAEFFKYAMAEYISFTKVDSQGAPIRPPLFEQIDNAVPNIIVQAPSQKMPGYTARITPIPRPVRDLVLDIHGKSIDDIIDDMYRKIFSEDSDVAKDVYVALVQDSLTNLSSSVYAGGAYGKVIAKAVDVDKIIDEVLASFSPKGVYGQSVVKKPIKDYIRAIYKEAFFTQGLAYMKGFSGSSDYMRAIYPKLRQETTPLFFDTMKTAIKQAAKQNIATLSKGPLEQISTIPLAITEGGRLKRELLSRSDIEKYTEVMEQMQLSSTVRKLEDQTLAANIDKAIQDGLDATVSLRKGAESEQNIMNRFSKILAEVFGTPETWFADGRLARAAKGGVLAGNLLPNVKYLMTNFLTAPAIIYGQLGADSAFTFNRSTVSSMKALTGGNVLGSGVFDVRIAASVVPVEIAVISPSGKIYTNYDIAEIVSKNSIARSQASIELTNKVMEDIVSFSGIQQSMMSKQIPARLGLNSVSKDQVQNMLRQNFVPGSDRAMNAWQEIGNLSDTGYRTNVLITSLKNGDSEADAMKLAREALFDYGNLSSIERATVAKVFWFWSFRRNSYRMVIKNFLTNPTRMKNVYQANGYLEEVDREYNYNTRDYAESRPFIFLVDDQKNKQRYGLYGPSIPQLDATSQMLDHLALGMPLLNDSLTGYEALTKIGSMAIDTTGEMASPAFQTGIGLSFGIDVRREGRDLGYYLDPKLMFYLQSNPEIWSTFSTYINVEKVPLDEIVPGRATYQGAQWRIQRGDKQSVKAWFAIQQLLLTTGIQRNLREYAPLLDATIGVAKSGDQISPSMGGTAEGRAGVQILNFVGISTPIEQPKIKDQIEFNKRALAEEFYEGTYRQ